TKLKENLNYSKKNIRDIWEYKKDKNGHFVKDANGNRVKKRQTMTYNGVTINLWDDTSLSNVIGDEKFANWRYGAKNKKGNQVNYRGRGYIHITWKENYQSYTNYYQAKHNDTTKDFVETPELLEQFPYALEASFNFWKQNNLHTLSDTKTVRDITLIVNGGLEGLSNRKNNFKKIYDLVK
ncbi:hypothetical protein, partial [Sulfurimonas sp.]|uniref:hypothetical protein n=1 Tax=Sulfurimonas sp. TaxID=2022749 RepID=UPI003D09C0D3